MASIAGCRDLVANHEGGRLLSNLMHIGRVHEMPILLEEHDYHFLELYKIVLSLVKNW